MPSKLDPHLPLIASWLANEPQLTALAIVGRLAERDPEHFGPKQHSIVQRLLRKLRTKSAQQHRRQRTMLLAQRLSQAPKENSQCLQFAPSELRQARSEHSTFSEEFLGAVFHALSIAWDQNAKRKSTVNP